MNELSRIKKSIRKIAGQNRSQLVFTVLTESKLSDIKTKEKKFTISIKITESKKVLKSFYSDRSNKKGPNPSILPPISGLQQNKIVEWVTELKPLRKNTKKSINNSAIVKKTKILIIAF